jgi:pyridinium-3,5-biscarboxylic acid mononucleotide sulfurtransferase
MNESPSMDKYGKLLEEWFKNHPRVLVALSGGVDSCLVAYLARKYNGKEKAVSLIGVSPSLKKRDLILAETFCSDNDIKYLRIYPNEINDTNYASNPVNRCYFCKSALYKEMVEIQQQNFAGFDILNGNNYSDRGDYRPGMKAAGEFQALSPLMDCGLEKETIRQLALKYKLKVWDKPASPCLSSRFPYGENITVEKLNMVEKAEEIIFDMGFSDVRVRINNSKAVVEVPSDEISRLKGFENDLIKKFDGLGFRSLQLDEEGLVSGKLNRGIVKDLMRKIKI